MQTCPDRLGPCTKITPLSSFSAFDTKDPEGKYCLKKKFLCPLPHIVYDYENLTVVLPRGLPRHQAQSPCQTPCSKYLPHQVGARCHGCTGWQDSTPALERKLDKADHFNVTSQVLVAHGAATLGQGHWFSLDFRNGFLDSTEPELSLEGRWKLWGDEWKSHLTVSYSAIPHF